MADKFVKRYPLTDIFLTSAEASEAERPLTYGELADYVGGYGAVPYGSSALKPLASFESSTPVTDAFIKVP